MSKHSCNSMSSEFPRSFPIVPIRNPSDFPRQRLSRDATSRHVSESQDVVSWMTLV